jgi:hypothetical protein
MPAILASGAAKFDFDQCFLFWAAFVWLECAHCFLSSVICFAGSAIFDLQTCVFTHKRGISFGVCRSALTVES